MACMHMSHMARTCLILVVRFDHVGQSSPVPTQFLCPPLFTTHTHVHTQPQDDDSRSSATNGEADQPTLPDRQQDPELGNSVQDLIQQAFSYTTLSTQQGIA